MEDKFLTSNDAYRVILQIRDHIADKGYLDSDLDFDTILDALSWTDIWRDAYELSTRPNRKGKQDD